MENTYLSLHIWGDWFQESPSTPIFTDAEVSYNGIVQCICIFIEKYFVYKWTCAVQTHAQESTVF